jgi:hypothetical protein
LIAFGLWAESLSKSRVGMTLVVFEFLLGPGDQVFLAWRKLNKADTGMGESKDVHSNWTIQARTRPKCDTNSVERCEVSTERRPLEV